MAKQYPISHPQRRILNAEIIDSSTDKYLIYPCYGFKNADLSALRTAVANVVAQCADLNLRFKLTADSFTVTQYVGPPDLSRIKLLDFSSDPEAMRQYLNESRSDPFEPLWDAPLYEFTIVHSEAISLVQTKIHHAISDGSGVVYLGQLLNNAYQAALQNSVFKPHPSAYLDYLEIEQQYLASPDFRLDQAYWTEIIAATAVFPESLVNGPERNAIRPIKLEASLVAELNQYCATLPVKVTPFKLAVALIGVYLSRRYTAASIPLLTASANRRGLPPAVANSIGMLVATLILKLDYQPEMRFTAYLEQATERLKAALDHGRYPLDLLTEEVAARGGDTSRLWNFSVVSNSKRDPGYEFNYNFNANSAFALIFRINRNQDDRLGLQTIDIEYLRDRFAAEADWMAEGIVALLDDIVANPDKPLADLEILGSREKKLLLEQYQGPRLDYDQGKTFLDHFRAATARDPEGTAIVDLQSSLTYTQTDIYTDRLARELIRLGVTANSFVGVMLPRRKEFMVAVIGVMKAGGAYVPLDHEYPRERIAYMLEDSQAKVLITEKGLYEQKGLRGENVLLIDKFDFDAERNPDIQLPTATPENLAYLIYTSGSTGKPKGVMISQQSLAAFLAWRTRDYQLTANDRICCHNSFSFDASVYDLFAPLTVVGQLHIISEGLRQNLPELDCYLKEHQITDASFVTQLGMELLNQFDPPLKSVTLGGEKLKAVRRTNIKIVNSYGPTEFTICASNHLVDQTRDGANIPIGKPVSNSWAYVVDQHNNLLPIGVAGELCLAGPQIALGYWGRADLTAEKFVANPFQTCAANAKMYRTGDLVRWNAHGELEYSGRIDNQIKLRGFRIELGEVESAMLKFPGITASVAEIKTIGQAPHLCGYFTADAAIDAEQLKEHLSQSLTEYMVPTALLQLAKFPLTPGGKVDRKALPDPEIGNYNEYVAPTNELEARLCEIFAETLGLERAGVTAGFFELGGTSLLAMKVVVKATALNIGITYANVFKYQTPQKLAAFLSGKRAETLSTDIGAYDYSAINQLLAKNTLGEITVTPIGDILLTGATEFLGIHVLREFLENYPGKAYCLVRPSDGASASARLQTRLVYYFDHDYRELFGKRLFAVTGDVNDLKSLQAPVATVINCEVNLKHFTTSEAANGQAKVNIGGVRNLIAYCLEHDAMLIQYSTISIAGTGAAAMKDLKLKEDRLYLGQTLFNNEYMLGRFLAERMILEAVGQGLKAKIMRTGNPWSRNADGEYQINFAGNSFMNRLKSYKLLGKFPVTIMNDATEISPIDCTAQALLKLAGTNSEYTVFHPCNNHPIFLSDVIYAMKEYGFTIDIVSEREFAACLREKTRDERTMAALTGILAYQGPNPNEPLYQLGATKDFTNEVRYRLGWTNEFTTEILYRLNFKWPMTSEDYLKKAIAALDGLGFFEA